MYKYIPLLLIILLVGCSTPSDKLRSAIYNGQATPEVIDHYLSEGARLNAAGGDAGSSSTMLGYCAKRHGCDFDTFKALIERGSDPSKIWRSDRDMKWGPQHAIHEMALIGRKNKEIRYLVEEVGVPVDIVGYEGQGTPLAIAYTFSEPENIKLLYELGADPSKLTLHGRSATVEDLTKYGVKIRQGSEALIRERKRKQKENADNSFLTKALVIGVVAVIAGTSDISSANQIDVVSSVATDVIYDTNGENTAQIYAKAKNQAESVDSTNTATIVKAKQAATPLQQQNGSESNQVVSSGLCRASLWGAYRTIYWDGLNLQCANGATPTFDNTTFWMGQYCDENQPNRDPNKITRCQGAELESARAAAKATMPSAAWPKWGL